MLLRGGAMAVKACAVKARLAKSLRRSPKGMIKARIKAGF
jgi:hypothetical protein